MKELDCLFIGSSTKDILMLVEAPPASDQRIAARQLEITCGGVSAIAVPRTRVFTVLPVLSPLWAMMIPAIL